jgi:hypothetical protein
MVEGRALTTPALQDALSHILIEGSHSNLS